MDKESSRAVELGAELKQMPRDAEGPEPMPSDLESVEQCPVCKSDRQSEVLKEQDYLFPGGQITLVRCGECGLVFLNPRLQAAAMVRLENQSDVYYLDAIATEREVEARVALLRSLVSPVPTGGRLLDVGCNRGLLLEAARRLAWDPVGVELSPVSAERAREATGLPVYEDLHHVPRRGGFGLIVAWHVLEHTTSPIPLLSQVARLLSPQGTLAIQVPSFDYLDEFRTHGRLGSLVCAVHNLYFTQLTLLDTLRREKFPIRLVTNSNTDLMLTVLSGRPRVRHMPVDDADRDETEQDVTRRSRRFESDPHQRFWWHHLPCTRYVPPIYGELADNEWLLLESWFEETAKLKAIGEINVPAMSVVQGLVMGNGLSRIVQLGHYFGYSALLLGFMLRAMNARPGLFSVDISPEATAFTQRWVNRAGLAEYVHLHVGDSADEESADLAARTLDGAPQLILFDTSHKYEHTVRELDLWASRMLEGSLMILHDSSMFASEFDATNAGGVVRALGEWLSRHPEVACLNINKYAVAGANSGELSYRDGCGLAILQRQPVRTAALDG